ncbi:MAG: hypothetical protein ACK5DD_11565, partial [Cyclobacteriaceae bacterium]
ESEPEKQTGPLVNGKPPRAKNKTGKAKQTDLFGEEKKEVGENPGKRGSSGGKTFTAGDSIELDL